MKVGVHAGEPLDLIVDRKRNEERDDGFFLWGYGGVLCHPRTQIKPFAALAERAGDQILLVMLPTPSKHLGDGRRAGEMSPDGRRWSPLPRSAEVKGSRFALTCRSLTKTNEEIDLSSYRVAVGGCAGAPVAGYLRGRVDKSCAIAGASPWTPTLRRAAYVAEVIPPYSVFVR